MARCGETWCLRNVTRGTTVCARVTVADTSLTRLVGLAGRRRLDAGCGLLIRPSSGVHTFGMLFPIDVVGLSKSLRVVRAWHRLAPFRMTGVSWKISSVLELPAGWVVDCGLQVEDQLELVSSTPIIS